MGRRIGIVGSRQFPSRDVVHSFIKKMPTDTVIVSGGAEGVDSWSVEIGNELEMGSRPTGSGLAAKQGRCAMRRS